jgi:hypothetical protein
MIVLHESDKPLKRVRFAPGGRTVATCGDTGKIRVWDLNVPARSRVLSKGYDHEIVFTSDGLLLSYCGSGVFQGMDVITLEVRDVSSGVSGYWANQCLAVDSNGRVIFVNRQHRPHRLECWSWREARLLWQSEDPLQIDPAAAVISPDGQWLATISFPAGVASFAVSVQLRTAVPAEDVQRRKPTIEIWHTASGRVRYSASAAEPVTSMAFSPDNSTLACVAAPTVEVRDLYSQDLVATLRGELRFKAVAFDPSGRLLATTGNDGVVRFWDTATWAERVAFDWGLGAMWDVTFSADGLTAACCGMAGKIVIWDVDV